MSAYEPKHHSVLVSIGLCSFNTLISCIQVCSIEKITRAMITLIFTISGEYFGEIDQDSNGEIDGQEATDAINYMIENDLMTEAK